MPWTDVRTPKWNINNDDECVCIAWCDEDVFLLVRANQHIATSNLQPSILSLYTAPLELSCWAQLEI